MTVRAIVTDIEGTTSSLRFVHDVLFPYATRELPGFVRTGQDHPDIIALLDATRKDAGEPDASLERVIEILLSWIREDRKATPLKALQGLVWRRGYEQRDFTGHLYADAVDRLQRWSASGIRLYVYSSGSVAAQRLLFQYSDAGDLRRLFSGYFDTRCGSKRDAGSYRGIAESVGLPAGEILFLSDVLEELDAARQAGMRTCQLARDDGVVTGSHPVATNFQEVIISEQT